MTTVADAPALALSRHTRAKGLRMSVEARHANAWCRFPGTLFAGGLVLLPNHPDREPVTVSYGPFDIAGANAVTLLLASGTVPDHGNTLAAEAAVLDSAGEVLARRTLPLRPRERLPLTLAWEQQQGEVSVVISVSFAAFRDSSAYGTIRLRYALAYAMNPLVLLCNDAGTDKGTEPVAGEGFPHCYALEYFPRFAPMREETFDLLEIGLDNNDPPRDAPSLRVWHDFFPNARLHGFDLQDFGFFRQDRTQTFRGDQSSREDLLSFVEEAGRPTFRIVIDDGSHASSHQQTSLAALFPHLEPGGVYAIEDLGWQPFPESPTTLDVLRAFVGHRRIESPFISETEARILEDTIERVDICRPNDSEVAFVYRKQVE